MRDISDILRPHVRTITTEMTGVSVSPSATYLDDVTLARAAARWGAFFASIDDDECQLLDRFALGDNLKSICFELGLSYDEVSCKRWSPTAQAAICFS